MSTCWLTLPPACGRCAYKGVSFASRFLYVHARQDVLSHVHLLSQGCTSMSELVALDRARLWEVRAIVGQGLLPGAMHDSFLRTVRVSGGGGPSPLLL